MSTLGMALLATVSRSHMLGADSFFGESSPLAKVALMGFLVLDFGGAALSLTMYFVWYGSDKSFAIGRLLPPIGISLIAIR